MSFKHKPYWIIAQFKNVYVRKNAPKDAHRSKYNLLGYFYRNVS